MIPGKDPVILKAEVGFPNDLVLEQLVAGAFGDDFARGKDIITGGHLKDRANLLLNEKHSDSQIADLFNFFKYLCSQNGGQAGGGLINTQQFGPRHQSSANGKHLLLPAGEGPGYLVGPTSKCIK